MITIPASIRGRLDEVFRRPIGARLEESEFDALALDVFSWQFERNTPYAAFCMRRDRTPSTVAHWTEIPAVPTAAFREAALIAGDVAAATAVFRTSGTTRGRERRGTHYIADVSLYDACLLPNFAQMLLPDGLAPVMLSLIPSSAEAPDSSLSHMVETVIARFGAPASAWLTTTRTGIDVDRLSHVLDRCIERGDAVCLLGTSFAFVHWLDHLEATHRRYALPPGSRIMDTGGFKGRSREVDAESMRAAYADRLGIAATHCVNEYGMTEMCSQFYDSTLRDHAAGVTGTLRRKVIPPWVRTRPVDAETLGPVGAAERGLLQHFDLANAGSVCAIQTEDIGEIVDDGFRVTGRATGAEARGCSIAMDDLLLAIGRQP